jgi:peptidoglycan hydrolase CwlO-like protein
MGYTTSFTNKLKKKELIELLNKVHDENCEFKNELRDVKGSRDAYYRWSNEKNEIIDNMKKENKELKKLIDKQHEEIQEIKKKLKQIITCASQETPQA